MARFAGTHQPDCLAALTVAHDVLAHSTGSVTIVSPLDIERSMRRSGALVATSGVDDPPNWRWSTDVGRRVSFATAARATN